MKKFLSILLALTLVIGLLPAIGALAVEHNATTWTKVTDLTQIEATDVIAVTSVKGDFIAVLPNNGYTATPSAILHTASIDSNTLTVIADKSEIGWSVSYASPNFTFKSIHSDGKYLFIDNASKGVKLSSSKKTVILEKGFLTGASGRRMGVYSNTDWRSYKDSSGAINSAFTGQTIVFWKFTGTTYVAPSAATPATVAEALAETDNAKKLSVTGVVTFVDSGSGYTNFYIQDSTGSIRVSSSSASVSVTAGEKVTVEGNSTSYNTTLKQLTYSSHTADGTASPVAQNVAIGDLTMVDHFAKYVTVTGRISVLDDNNGGWSTANITLVNDTGDATVVVYKAAIDKTTVGIGDKITVTGTVDQANNSPRIRTHSADQFILSKHTSHSNEDNKIESDNDNHWKVCDICGASYDSETHTDTATQDHKCDICQAATGDAHEPAQGSHNCAYCGKPADSGCVDTTEKDHVCDICGEPTGDAHTPATGSHNCAYCGKPADEGCVDTSEKDHVCDICGEPTGPAHTPATGSHNCAYCGKPADEGHTDGNDADHNCDICGEPNVKGHVDADNNKMCDECNAALCEGEHVDEANGKDHKCDRCQADMGGECKAAEGTHACEYCGDVKSECVDTTPKDHKCDICKTAMGGDCVAAEGEHTCDYCGATKSECSDSATDKDHKCDVCGKDEMNAHDWADATTEAPKTCKICGKTEGEPLAPNSAGLITDISKLKDGDKIVIIATGANKGLSTTQKSNNRGTTAIVKTGNTVDLPNTLQVFEVDILENGKITLKCVNGDTAGKYIFGGFATSNYLRVQDEVNEGATWNITISADGIATIKCDVPNSRNWMRFNSSKEGLFACYGSGQQDISIYKVGYAGDAPQEVKATETNVAGIKNAANGDKLQIKGLVTNVFYATIYIQDETGAVKVVLGANFPGKVGDTIVVTGIKNDDGSIASATYEASSGMTLTAKEITAANLSTLDVGVYVKIAGLTVTKVNVNDDDKITSIEFADGSVSLVSNGTILSDDAIKAGDKVTVTGTNAGDGKIWNVSYVVTEAGTGSEDDDDNTGSEGGNTGSEGGNTGSDEDDNTGNEGGNSGNEGTTTPVTKPSVQANPVVGNKYMFALHHVNEGKTLFFTGKMNGWYLDLSDDASKAVDVQMESVDGGYRLFFMQEGKKTYIDIIPRENAEGKVNVVLTETPTAVFTYDKALKTFTTNVVEKTWYLGTYGTYTTISASETWRITGDNASALDTTQFVAHMYAMTTSNVPSNGDTTLSVIVALFVISAMGVVALVSKKKEF